MSLSPARAFLRTLVIAAVLGAGGCAAEGDEREASEETDGALVHELASYSPSLLRTNPAFGVTYSFLRSSGLTDGVTMTDDQDLGDVGHRLGVVPADHWDLFGALPVAASSASTRRAFTRVLFSALVGDR